MACRRVAQNAKLETLPVTHSAGPDPEPAEHLGIKPTAVICPMEQFPAHLGNKRQEDIEEKRTSPILNKIWCYFSPSVMPLLLQISLAVKGIDCESEPQLGLKRRKQHSRVWAVTSR